MRRLWCVAVLVVGVAQGQERQPGQGVNFYTRDKEIALGQRLALDFSQKTTPLDIAPAGGAPALAAPAAEALEGDTRADVAPARARSADVARADVAPGDVAPGDVARADAAPAVLDEAFKLATGAVSDPIATDNGTAVIKVLEKKEVTPEEWTTSKDHFRDELLSDRRSRFFSAYMVKAKQKMKIEVNREALQRATS